MSLSDLANLATAVGAVGVFIAAWQISTAKKQAETAFEDTLAKEYRELAARLPTKALLGESLSDQEHEMCFDEMYHYFDLCNEQVFLAQTNRISGKTWKFWEDGIKSNLRRAAFARAWSEIAARSGNDFSELRSIVPPNPIIQPVVSG